MEIIIGLIILGILLLLAELLLVPGVGVAGIGGFLSLAGACWWAFEKLGVRQGWITLAVVAALILAFTVWVLRAKTWKRFELKEEITEKVNKDSEKIEVGARGETITRLAPMGTARFGGLSLEVKSADNSMVDPKTPVVVVSVEDNKVTVKPE